VLFHSDIVNEIIKMFLLIFYVIWRKLKKKTCFLPI
jgi:hypothetical protein